MKKLFLILVSVFAFNAVVMAEVDMKQIKKEAKKEAKTLTKEGWKVAPGGIPLVHQLEDAYAKQYDKDELGFAKYYIGTSQPIAEFYDAANLQAMSAAKLDIARQLGSHMKAVIEQELANKQLPKNEAVSVAQVTAKATESINAKLGRVAPVMECSRVLENGNIQLMMRVAYPTVKALEEAKAALREKLEAEVKGLSEKLDCLK